jgi:hypothetical protein
MNRLIAMAAAALFFACAGQSGAPVSFSVTTAHPTAAASALVVAGNIDIQRVRLNIGRLKLEGPASAAVAPAAVAASSDGGSDDFDGGSDGGAGQAGEVELRQGPFVVDLDAAALSGAVTKVFDADVPAGTYREFRFEIFPGPGLGNASLIVDGTIDGQPFTFTSSLAAAQKKEGSFVVGSGSANITLAFDPALWFGTAGARLDPRSETNRAAIEANVRGSLDVFQDDDRSGHENHRPERSSGRKIPIREARPEAAT